ncbi:MAG: DNA polymerase III subunit beta [Bdellovibrionaceae bacterium]|nr:DNA polymerase III subunit beta [Pseudobdellovibrionaceae bacterium]
MDIKIKKEDVFPILSQIQGILEKRSTLPIFSHILIKTEKKDIQIYASDSELSFWVSLPAQIKKEGAIVLNGKKFFEIVRELAHGIFEVNLGKNHQVHIKQFSSFFKINGLNPEDFPKFPTLKKGKKQNFLAGDILEVIDKTLYCVSLDESRYHLTGVFLEQSAMKYRFVSTDGHRMSFIDIKGTENEELEQGIIIPRKGFQELKKMLSGSDQKETVELSIEKPRLLVRFKNQNLNIRLIEGQYPNYKSLIPKKTQHEVIISTLDFLSALKRISALTSARFKGVNFTFTKANLRIDFSHPEVGEAEEKLACNYKGEELKVRFNSKYILDILHSIQDEKIKFLLTDNRSPGLIKAHSQENYVCLVMPMKL